MIHCFDKSSEKCFPANINQIGGEKHFYDTLEDHDQSVENALSKLESKFSHPYRKLIKTKDLSSLNKSDKTFISTFLLTQWFRTRETRERIKNYNKQLKEFLSTKGELSENLKKELDTNYIYTKNMHIPLFKEIPNHIPYVFNMKWTLTINKTKEPFWSSDSPVTLDNFVNPSKFNSYGLYSKGINIHFPLSPNLLLSFSDPLTFYFLPEKIECKNMENIIYHNALQIKSSYRTLFSNCNNFDLAKKILKDHPIYKDPNRKIWVVKSLKNK